MIAEDLRVVLVGVGGFGATYVHAFLDSDRSGGTRIAAVVDPDPKVSAKYEQMKSRGAVFCDDLAGAYAVGPADLVIISAPIHLHVPYACQALQGGSSVLCEKPLAGSVADARRAATTADEYAGFLAVGYQWSFSDAVQALKADVMAGVFGRALRFKTYCCWPRGAVYYARNNWAGRIRMPDGAWVQDSPVNNATAHYLHNMLYLLGPSRETSASPESVRAELYRAKPIENYDTAAIRCRTSAGVEVLFYTTHSGLPRVGPVSEFQFEHAVVTYDDADGGRFVARFSDGTVRDYGRPEDSRNNKIWQCVAAIRTGEPVACDARAAIPQALCVDAARHSSPIVPLPEDQLATEQLDGGDFICMPSLNESLAECYRQSVLPSEIDLPWARPGKRVDPARLPADV